MRPLLILAALCLFGSSAWAQTTPAPAKVSPFWALTADAPSYEIANGKAIATLVSQGTNYMGLLIGKAGLKVPIHAHPKSTEMLYVLSGGGTMIIQGRRQTVSAGMVIQVPPGIQHGFEMAADAKEDFKAVQVYSPAGPEQRFKKGRLLPKKKAVR